MIIKLTQSKEIIIREAETITTDTIFINQVTDNGTSVEALITIGDTNLPVPKIKTIILWEAQDYIDIGQWTDSDVEVRIKQLI